MYINSIEISNFRSIGSNPPLKLDISDITVLSGINDTGKTSALLASFLGLNSCINVGNHMDKDLSKLLDGSTHRKGFSEDNSRQCIRLFLKCTREDLEKIGDYVDENPHFEKILKDLNDKGVDIEREKIKQFFSDAVIILSPPLRPELFGNLQTYVDREFWNDQTQKFFGYDDIINFSDILYRLVNTSTELTISMQELNCLYVPGVTRSNEQVLIKEEDKKSQLVTFFKDVCSERGKTSGKYKKFMEYFKILLPELVRIEINSTQGDEKYEDIFLIWNQNGHEKEQPLSRSGDGIYNIIFLVAKVLNNFSKMNIVFIDEPEIGLHPMLQQRFIKLIRKISREFSIQWVLATHSPFILQFLKNNEKLYLIKHDGNQTNCQDINIANKEIVFSTLGAYLPLALSATGVIFVEGQTEVTILTILLDKVGLNIERERILIIPLGGENLFQIDAKDLKKLHEKSMVIIDSDLPKSEDEGGNIKQVKSDYKNECIENNVEFLMIKDYRTLENMYPKEILADVLGKEVESLDYGNFDEVPGIRNKIKVGEEIANKMSKEEAERFPLIKEIQKWWSEK
ncbi:AAA family ATPase [Bacillus thuringiensis]|uniref:ATP-dependent nuclease n=1 Tax=Bacillus thuringiensis TaxID=1428 RepID=UPI001CD56C15|nr:AAA family ATPase [Bacillus thuringiensis]MCA1002803.1 AAA family ATPase [Bacillus thuringiensis]